MITLGCSTALHNYGLLLTAAQVPADSLRSPSGRTAGARAGSPATPGQIRRDRRGTADSPLVVTLTQSAAGREQLTESEHLANERAIANGTVALAVATVLLVIVTGVLARFTWKLWNATKEMARDARTSASEQAQLTRDAIAQASRSADAAMTSAKAAVTNVEAARLSERAHVYVDTERTRKVNDGHRLQPGAVFWLCFANLGRTPTHIEAQAASYRLWNRDELHHLRAHPDTPIERLGVWLGAGFTTAGQQVSLAASADDLNRVLDGTAVAAILGRVQFVDVFGEKHETGFALEFVGGDELFRTVQNANLNYSR